MPRSPMVKKLAPLLQLKQPAYIADRARIKSNLQIAARIKQEAGCKILLATKAFSMFSLFPDFASVLDGSTASGLYEAQLGHEYFGGEVHVFSPGYTSDEIRSLLPIAEHIYFNSISQLNRFAPLCEGKKIGLRLNPEFSQVTNSSLYDPSAKGSRFGVKAADITPEIAEKIDILHVHNLCENLSGDSIALIEHLMQQVPHLLKAVACVNLGGGHYITHADYDVDALISAIHKLKAEFDLQVILEPGGALVYEAGYLVTQVVDIIENDGRIAVLNTSATCHMPDVLEVPYTPPVIYPDLCDATKNAASQYNITLAGKTCLTGDVIGTYDFVKPLAVGDRIIFGDMMQYSMVKNTTFNGMPLPDIGVLEEDGSLRIVKQFSYDDFKNRLS